MSRSAAPSKWDLHLERAAQRSQAHRDRAREIGRPAPAQVDRAIVEACQTMWERHIRHLTLDDPDPDALRAASAKPINLWKVAERAVAILVERKRADPTEASKMVMARLSPRPAFTVKVAKADQPLKAFVADRETR